MNEIVDRLWLKTREHIGDLLDQAEQSIGTMRGLVQRADAAATRAGQHEAGAAAAAAAEVSKLKGDAPEAFDTLEEIAEELAKNETERAALANSIGEKARREEVDAALAGKADTGHRHPEYATTTQVNARTPEIRIVSSPEMATTQGVLYVVREG